MAAPIPIGNAVKKVIKSVRREPRRAPQMPAISGALESEWVKKAPLNERRILF